MATESNENPKNQGPELSKTVEGDGKDVKGEAANEASEEPVFTIPQPIREDQVQNAVKFLSHPRVRGSPIIHRRSFLERKGLTKEEIDEAFRRVPDPPPNTTSVEASTKSQAVQPKSSTGLQPQALVQTPQPAAAPASGVSVASSLQKSRFHWSHALLATGVLAASGAGTAVLIKNVVVPKLKSWIRKVIAEESESDKKDKQSSRLAEEATEAARAAASAAGAVAIASQELLNAKNEERKYFEAFMGALDMQVKEMKSMGDAIHKLESKRETSLSQEKLLEEYMQSTVGNGPANNSWRTSQVSQPDAGLPSMFSKQAKVNGMPNMDFGRARPSSTPASVDSISAPHTKPSMEEINDMHPSPDQPPTKPLSAPRPKPYWEVHQQPQQSPSHDLGSQSSDEVLSSEIEESTNPSFLIQTNGKTHDASEPWWRRKTAKITEIEPEMKEPKQFPYGIRTNEGPSQRRWVPPQPPAISMPDAAAAIRHPKPSAEKQPQSGDERSAASSDAGEERIAKAPDSAVEVETSIVAEKNQNTEIQEEQADGIEVN